LGKRNALSGGFVKRIAIVALVLAAALAALAYLSLRPYQSETPLFDGITYTSGQRWQPRLIAFHVVRVDLTNPNIRLTMTPPEPDGDDYTARTTSGFLREFGVQLAVNAACCDPWHAASLFDYFPHSGDRVKAGIQTLWRGRWLERSTSRLAMFYFSETGQVMIAPRSRTAPDDAPPYGIGGTGGPLLEAGVTDARAAAQERIEPRTAFGLDERGHTLIIAVVDGRNAFHSLGVTFAEMADLMREFGAYDAINMDGGGSSTLVMADANGSPRLLNTPIQTGIPGMERPIAVALGVCVVPLSSCEAKPQG
jgi:hypothetical protein